MIKTDFSFPKLTQLCVSILRKHPNGITEYELIAAIKAAKKPGLEEIYDQQGEASLFRLHFTLFHALYQLKQYLYSHGSNGLFISPLKITLTPFKRHHKKQLNQIDVLEEYYRDLNQLKQTTDKEIHTLLDNFWSHMIRDGKRSEALTILKLKDPVSNLEIKKQYRKLAFECHPDRGGDPKNFQAITNAMCLLSGK